MRTYEELGRWLSNLGPGEARALFTRDPAKRALRLQETSLASRRLLVCAVHRYRSRTALIEQCLGALAEVALVLWPDWSTPTSAQRASFPHSKIWRAKAKGACARGKRPLFRSLPLSVQAAELSGALASLDLVVALVVKERTARSGELFTFASVAEWLAHSTGLPVVTLLPSAWRGDPALDHVAEGAILFEDEPARKPVEPSGSLEAPKVRPKSPSFFLVPPVEGKPHPGSEGERLLGERLKRDPELQSLFSHNQLVFTPRNSKHRVDLLWEAGKIIVEVDGYQFHSGKAQFFADRNRDYETSLAGYLTLRLTHAEVVSDVQLAMEKIRDFVRLRRNQHGRDRTFGKDTAPPRTDEQLPST